jgi:mono/diheme cytochrome c family protein
MDLLKYFFNKKMGSITRCSLFLIILILSTSACTKSSKTTDLAAKGKVIYNQSCTVCHNMNPKKDGVLGPALSGSSFELLKHKVTQNSYPAGYTPKRKTNMMTLTPNMKKMTDKELNALVEYLKTSGN